MIRDHKQPSLGMTWRWTDWMFPSRDQKVVPGTRSVACGSRAFCSAGYGPLERQLLRKADFVILVLIMFLNQVDGTLSRSWDWSSNPWGRPGGNFHISLRHFEMSTDQLSVSRLAQFAICACGLAGKGRTGSASPCPPCLFVKFVSWKLISKNDVPIDSLPFYCCLGPWGSSLVFLADHCTVLLCSRELRFLHLNIRKEGWSIFAKQNLISLSGGWRRTCWAPWRRRAEAIELLWDRLQILAAMSRRSWDSLGGEADAQLGVLPQHIQRDGTWCRGRNSEIVA